MNYSFLKKIDFDWDGLDFYLNEIIFSDFIGKKSNEFIKVKLPDFVKSYGLKENILYFPVQFLEPHKFEDIVVDYEKCNWIGAIEHLVSLKHENINFFSKINPTSNQDIPDKIYSFSLVNRYLLFLRDYIAFKKNRPDIIGKIRNPKILLTHDVDAIKASLELKIRQFFHNKKWPNFKKNENLLFIKEIVEMEKKFNVKSIFFFSAFRPLFSIPFVDPKYKLKNLKDIFDYLNENNFQIGLHPSILSSLSFLSLKSEIKKINSHLINKVTLVRNHWLSLFIERTWKIQLKNGIKADFTLGFNNIPGFRNFCSLKYYPYPNLKVIPTIIMDGHFFNYGYMKGQDITELIKPFILEIKNVGGIASIDFHQRFFHEYYGYKSIYNQILVYLKEEELI